MDNLTVILGYGATGRNVVERLLARGDAVRVAQRSRPADLPPGAQFIACDGLDSASLDAAIRGARQVVMAIGLAYDAKVWRRVWPPLMSHVLSACEAHGARLVFIDNLYMLGPQTAPLTEDMPLTDRGAKPAIRAEVTRLWRAAAEAGRVRVAAIRPPDFYGPGVGNSHLGDTALGALAQGKPALMVPRADLPHDFAFVPDIGRAAVTLLDAEDSAFNQVWNAPCAPTRTPRELVALAAAALGRPARLQSLPIWTLPALGLAVPSLAEVADMAFTFDRPYRVDWSKWAKAFWDDPTPFEIGIPLAARSFARPLLAAAA